MGRRRLALAFGCAAVAVASFGVMQLWLGPDPSGSERVLWSTFFTQWVWILVAVAAAALLPGPIAFRLGLKRGALGPVALVLVAAGTLCLSNALNLWLIDLEVRESGGLARIDRIVDRARGVAPWLAIVAMGLAPGIGEELLFRGLIQRTLATRVRPAAAVFLAAGLFGIIHLDPAHSPAAFALGLYLGTVGLLAGNVWAPVLCHAANNTVAVVDGLSGGPLSGIGSSGSVLVWAAMSGGLLAGAAWLTQRPSTLANGEAPRGKVRKDLADPR